MSSVHISVPALRHRQCPECGRAADVKAVVDLREGAEKVETLILFCRNSACGTRQVQRAWPEED